MLGSPADENSRGADEGPQTRVRITKGFWLGRTEVTQAQWRSVIHSNPRRFQGNTLPVEQVLCKEAAQFGERLTEQARASRRLPAGYVFALPTEAQWKYAAKAGAAGPFRGKVDERAWHDPNNGPTTDPVGTKQSNAWGLYDMLGNVWEWGADWYAPYPGGEAIRLRRTRDRRRQGAPRRQLASWSAGGATCERDLPQNGSDHLGFRLALVPAP